MWGTAGVVPTVLVESVTGTTRKPAAAPKTPAAVFKRTPVTSQWPLVTPKRSAPMIDAAETARALAGLAMVVAGTKLATGAGNVLVAVAMYAEGTAGASLKWALTLCPQSASMHRLLRTLGLPGPPRGRTPFPPCHL